MSRVEVQSGLACPGNRRCQTCCNTIPGKARLDQMNRNEGEVERGDREYELEQRKRGELERTAEGMITGERLGGA